VRTADTVVLVEGESNVQELGGGEGRRLRRVLAFHGLHPDGKTSHLLEHPETAHRMMLDSSVSTVFPDQLDRLGVPLTEFEGLLLHVVDPPHESHVAHVSGGDRPRPTEITSAIQAGMVFAMSADQGQDSNKRRARRHDLG
jgi:hypothetical protein